MTSSTAGDRRWASSKRGGMTVLGKVAVPKPINLPSQRLENHGLDPNVEIVPKGSLSWGARSSSSGSNAWGSSVLSPRTEGGNASPTHFRSRPSSGDGTRPSTAGSERTVESTSNLWTSNSRPSSASGLLASNNTSMMSLRPHSAENRPGSSQLSRFAEPVAEGTATWSASGSADKMGRTVTANDGFSLSSGDFPTLGSEKSTGNNMVSLDQNSHGRPNSSSGRSSTAKIEAAPSDVKNGMVDYWNNDGPQGGMERWHADPHSHPYPNPNIPPPFDTWRGGAPVNTPGGIWYRGPPGAPYGAPPMAAPGGFPYYCPQGPPNAGGPRGLHAKTGESCRPIMEPFMRPGMPVRPGFYPGYYGPPMEFCNPNEREFPFMGGVPTGPPVYSRYPNPNPNPNAPKPTNSNPNSCEGRAPEQLDCGPPHDPRRHYNVPAKQIMGWDKNVEEDKGYEVNSFPRENFWSQDQDHRMDEQMNYGKMPLQSKSSQECTDVNPVLEDKGLPRERDMCRQEPYGRGESVHSKDSHLNNKADAGVHLERHYPSGIFVPVSRDMTILAKDQGIGTSGASVKTTSRHSSHQVPGRVDYGGRGRFKNQKNSTSESPDEVTVVSSEKTNIQGQEHTEMPSTVTSRSDGEVKDDSMLSMSDSSDSQRAKMREIAKQRFIQLQKEEEERAREQKAKALAKLEELNRRSTNEAKETSSHKMDNIPSSVDNLQRQEQSSMKIQLHFGSIQSGEILLKANKSLEPDEPSGLVFSEINQHPVLSQKGSLPATDDAHINDVADTQRAQVCEISSQKKAGFKPKNNIPSRKNINEMPIVTATLLTEVEGKNVPSVSESKLPVDSSTISDSVVLPKRKNNRAIKNKHKVDESFDVSVATVQKESDTSKSVNESMKLKTAESKLEVIQPAFDSKDVGQSLEIHPSLPHDDARHRGSSTSKPQQARKLPRNSQVRYVEKSHSSDAVIWAPVKSHNKIDVIDDFDQRAEKGAIPSSRTDSSVPSNSKSKRAEMERYVPKAAMREPTQQGSNLISPSPSTEQYIPDGMSSKGEASSQKVAKNERQIERSSTESKFAKVSGDASSSMMNPGKKFQLQMKTQKPKEGSAAKLDVQFVKVQSDKQDKWPEKQDTPQIGEINEVIFVDGWNIIDEPVTSVPYSGAKDHPGRGKRNLFKGNRASGNPQNFSSKYHRGVEVEAEHYSETSQPDRPTSSKGKNVAQWQPKSQIHVSNQMGDGDHARQTDSSEAGKSFKRDTYDTAKSEVKRQISSVFGSKDVSRRPKMGTQDPAVVRKSAPSKDSAYSPKKDTSIEVDSAEYNDMTESEQHSSSGHNRNGNYNSRFIGDRSFTKQDNRQNYANANWEKQRQNSRYEYQPVQQQNNNSSRGEIENHHEGPTPRLRDQHPGTHMRRGGPKFYGGRQRTDAGYE